MIQDPENTHRTFELAIGTVVDERYKIMAKLGTGGSAIVYRAEQLSNQRSVALKVLKPNPDDDDSFLERFKREAQIACKLQHPNVVRIYDYGTVEENSLPYIAMELMTGRDLKKEITLKERLSPSRTFKLLTPIVKTLAVGHEMGIIHKDLKPENLYLIDANRPKEFLKLVDFGVARYNNTSNSKLTASGQIAGTAQYFAPEYIKQQIVTPALDVYQMALIFSETLSGRRAVDEDNYFAALQKHCEAALDIPDFLRQGAVGDVFKKALCIDHTQRYQNCGEFGKALDAIAGEFSSIIPLSDEKSSDFSALALNSFFNDDEDGDKKDEEKQEEQPHDFKSGFFPAISPTPGKSSKQPTLLQTTKFPLYSAKNKSLADNTPAPTVEQPKRPAILKKTEIPVQHVTEKPEIQIPEFVIPEKYEDIEGPLDPEPTLVLAPIQVENLTDRITANAGNSQANSRKLDIKEIVDEVLDDKTNTPLIDEPKSDTSGIKTSPKEREREAELVSLPDNGEQREAEQISIPDNGEQREAEQISIPDNGEQREADLVSLPDNDEQREADLVSLPDNGEQREAEQISIPDNDEQRETEQISLPDNSEQREAEQISIPDNDEQKEAEQVSIPDKPEEREAESVQEPTQDEKEELETIPERGTSVDENVTKTQGHSENAVKVIASPADAWTEEDFDSAKTLETSRKFESPIIGEKPDDLEPFHHSDAPKAKEGLSNTASMLIFLLIGCLVLIIITAIIYLAYSALFG